jgi:hypothetical protein
MAFILLDFRAAVNGKEHPKTLEIVALHRALSFGARSLVAPILRVSTPRGKS